MNTRSSRRRTGSPPTASRAGLRARIPSGPLALEPLVSICSVFPWTPSSQEMEPPENPVRFRVRDGSSFAASSWRAVASDKTRSVNCGPLTLEALISVARVAGHPGFAEFARRIAGRRSGDAPAAASAIADVAHQVAGWSQVGAPPGARPLFQPATTTTRKTLSRRAWWWTLPARRSGGAVLAAREEPARSVGAGGLGADEPVTRAAVKGRARRPPIGVNRRFLARPRDQPLGTSGLASVPSLRFGPLYLDHRGQPTRIVGGCEEAPV